MKAELINTKYIEKERKLKEKEDMHKKQMEEQRELNQKIQEQKQKQRMLNVEQLMKMRIDKINSKHQKIEKRRN
jgi:hypothetical protein